MLNVKEGFVEGGGAGSCNLISREHTSRNWRNFEGGAAYFKLNYPPKLDPKTPLKESTWQANHQVIN